MIAPNGQAFSQIPQPLQWSKSKSSLFPSFTGMELSGQTGTHKRHCLHFSSINSGVSTRHSPVWKASAVQLPTMVHPGVRSCHFTSSPSLLISDTIIVPPVKQGREPSYYPRSPLVLKQIYVHKISAFL